jgi:hypothetical protein
MESAKIIALQEALLAEGRSWGDVVYLAEQEVERGKSSAERKAKAEANAAATESLMKAANIEKKKAKFINRKGQLTKIAKKCKWECKGEKCWAHNAKACPYIHKNQKGSNEAHAVTLKKKGGKRTTRKRKTWC